MEAGMLGERSELIDGEIISKMSQNAPHRIVLLLIANWLATVFGRLCVQEQLPLSIPGALGKYNEPEPDMAVTREPTTAYLASHPAPDDLILAVEVADSSLEFDRTTKAKLYARTGVREYWIADVNNRCIHVHRNPEGDGYREYLRVDLGSSVSIQQRPDAVIEIAEFFRPLDGTPTGGTTAE
ncbi:MAG TPA: Uma2 family endonuclease [Chthonomonadaceae bacterium]|nr:Uma2 family endonuclease [Chthonomonadaceae bacterium]